MDYVFTGIGVLFIVAAILAPVLEACTQHRFPRRTLLPGGIAMILGVLLLVATL